MKKSSILQRACWTLAVLGVLLSSGRVPAELPNQVDGWKFDVVQLHTGRVFQGLLLEETPAKVRFQCVRHQPGEATKLGLETTFARHEIARIDRLGARDRADLEARLEKLKPAAEKERIDKIALGPAPWRGVANAGRSYTSEHFVLTSNARADIVRRVAVRLEQIYEAYVRYLPPRCLQVTRTEILLVASSAEYRQMLMNQVGKILNPAFFDPEKNQIVCGTDLQRLADELDRIQQKCQQLRTQITEQQAVLQKMKNPPPELRHKVLQLQTMILKAEKENPERFEKATERLFRTLYHEAFHAYLCGFIYPPGKNHVPRWLDEGLAQIFETAILEAGELRLGHADPERLKRVREALRKNQFLPVADLLKAGPDKFLVAHASDQQLSDAYYLGSWALAFYLTFGQRKLGTPELDEYVFSLGNGALAESAFSKLVGEPLPRFEKTLQRYLCALQTDGSTAR